MKQKTTGVERTSAMENFYPFRIFDPDTGADLEFSGAAGENRVLDILGDGANATADHYTDQWGPETNFQAFSRDNPDAMKFTPGRQLGWPALFEAIRTRSRAEPILVYDAACGFGGIMDMLFAEPVPSNLYYVGADVHRALGSIKVPAGVRPEQITFLRWDISNVLPVTEMFDYVVCRASIHHTPDPERTFRSLRDKLKPGGTLAISAYAKKARVREAVDDALRESISAMSVEETRRPIRELTLLARDLQKVEEKISIGEDLEFLGIKAGSYSVHQFIYDHLMKNWYNDHFGERYSDVVNFDWYHPPFAYRYERDDLKAWFAASGLKIVHIDSNQAQHYLAGSSKP